MTTSNGDITMTTSNLPIIEDTLAPGHPIVDRHGPLLPALDTNVMLCFSTSNRNCSMTFLVNNRKLYTQWDYNSLKFVYEQCLASYRQTNSTSALQTRMDRTLAVYLRVEWNSNYREDTWPSVKKLNDPYSRRWSGKNNAVLWEHA